VLGIGPVVGIPTAGAVISTVSWRLIDGGSVSMPHWGVYTLTGEDLEGTGRQPDYPVPYDPKTFNRDDQDPTVAKAVELLMKDVKEHPQVEVTPHIWPGSGRK
jgi:tricorn protease